MRRKHGGVLVYERGGAGDPWVATTRIGPWAPKSSGNFGSAIAILDGGFVVGAAGDATQLDKRVGEAFRFGDAFGAASSRFSATHILTNGTTPFVVGLGSAVAGAGNRIAVGAPGSDLQSGGAPSGAVFVYEINP